MNDINYFECLDDQQYNLNIGGVPRAHGLHSVTDYENNEAAIRIVAEYLLNTNPLANNHEQTDREVALRNVTVNLGSSLSNDHENLKKLLKSCKYPETIKKAFGQSITERLNIDFEDDMSNGPHPINLIRYKLNERIMLQFKRWPPNITEKSEFHQRVFFYSQYGYETDPLYLAQIEELLSIAQDEGFDLRIDGLQRAKIDVRSRYNHDYGKEWMRKRLMFLDESLRDELIEYILE